MKVSDYIFDYLADAGITHVFMVSGGAAMHLVDSLGRNSKLKYICNHHEQASAIAAEGYFRACGRPAAVLVTSGPGGTNALTGVIGQWLDSIPCIYLSGQVKRETTTAFYPNSKLRQLGDQEINIIDIVRPVTKYAVTVDKPEEIVYHLGKAIYMATSGRPGPVWLDLPLDIQASVMKRGRIKKYQPSDNKLDRSLSISRLCGKLSQRFKKAQRPVIVAGGGIRLSGAQDSFIKLVEALNIPVVTTFNGFDLIPTKHPLFIGRIGTAGDRAGNFCLQNSDLALFIGSRNNIRQISYNWKAFARAAFKAVVDIDCSELEKPTVKPNLKICADAGVFIKEFKKHLSEEISNDWKQWLSWCQKRKELYPVVLPEYKKLDKLVNPYYFIKILTECLSSESIVVAGNGSACVTLFQAGIVKKGQRMFWNSGCASMGYDLPAALGACFGNKDKNVVCIAGDGSLQMNIQEFQTLAHHKLKMKLFVLDNQGYVSIRQTQDAFFNGHRVGCSSDSGITLPDITKVASAYGLPACAIDSHRRMEEAIRGILKKKGPVVCNVKLTPDYTFSPKLASLRKPDGKLASKPLEDMSPFLPRKEFKSNMIIDTLNE
ncbi:MAG: thiamine pyrophosphate-binding protein [Candidatus Omnitrophica bacterium]|nr:thiamine pyrophosphate-binding protein [Candidatus Omnitrophota bacterium]MDD5429427.1 thiamine pyrophosphate-binding protein [Candidatus Omnitrophota bacterium]